jgi:hypothetical protein
MHPHMHLHPYAVAHYSHELPAMVTLKPSLIVSAQIMGMPL